MTSDPGWTTETEELVAAELRGLVGMTFLDSDADNRAEQILQALASAGLLLPPGGEMRTEWVAESVQPSGAVVRRPFVTDADDLAAFLADYLDWFRRTDSYATGHRVLQRTVHTGPWAEPQP